MVKLGLLLLAGNAVIGEDYIDYLGHGEDSTVNNQNAVPAAPADVRSNIYISEGGLTLNYILKGQTSTFSVNLWSHNDNLIFTFNEYPSFCVVKKVDSNGMLTPLYTVGHSSALKINEITKLSIQNYGGVITVAINEVDFIKQPFFNNGVVVHFYAFGNYGLRISDISVKMKVPKAFIVMQFQQEYNELYNEVIKPVCESMGFQVVRADESTSNGSIIDDILMELSEAAIVIADITPDNPNVYYEVGYAHAIKKNVILMCNEQRGRLPFDLSDVRTIFYKDSIAGNSLIKQKLQTRIESLINSNGVAFQ